jgi:hypothetical protein
MNRTGILPLVFLFAATSAFAQQSVTLDNSKSLSWTHESLAGAGCPLGMQASHETGLPVAMNAGPTINGGPIAPSIPAPARAQRIRLTLANLLAHDIASAQFVVHGFSDKGRAMNLANRSPAPDLAKTVDVVQIVKGKGQASSELSLSRFAAVTSIDLNSITYADGATWHTPSSGACSITPDLIMLVASTQ